MTEIAHAQNALREWANRIAGGEYLRQRIIFFRRSSAVTTRRKFAAGKVSRHKQLTGVNADSPLRFIACDPDSTGMALSFCFHLQLFKLVYEARFDSPRKFSGMHPGRAKIPILLCHHFLIDGSHKFTFLCAVRSGRFPPVNNYRVRPSTAAGCMSTSSYTDSHLTMSSRRNSPQIRPFSRTGT
jgi:hypothetical protein